MSSSSSVYTMFDVCDDGFDRAQFDYQSFSLDDKSTPATTTTSLYEGNEASDDDDDDNYGGPQQQQQQRSHVTPNAVDTQQKYKSSPSRSIKKNLNLAYLTRKLNSKLVMRNSNSNSKNATASSSSMPRDILQGQSNSNKHHSAPSPSLHAKKNKLADHDDFVLI